MLRTIASSVIKHTSVMATAEAPPAYETVILRMKEELGLKASPQDYLKLASQLPASEKKALADS